MPLISEHHFESPQEQIEWVKKYIESKKQQEHIPEETTRFEREAAKEALEELEKFPDHAQGAYKLTPEEIKEKSHALADEPHHNQVDELMNIAREKGLMSALQVARRIRNYHLVDDFHRRLIAEELSRDPTI